MPADLETLRKLALSLEDYQRIVQALSREPNPTELYIFSAMWSEHCGYRHSRRLLKSHLHPPGGNAGLVWIQDWGVAFKVESHNHPCAVEPFQGAATGIGGIIRDVIAMGARPVALLDSLHFSQPGSPLYEGVISGISVYGNSIGVPTVGGEVRFDPQFEFNPLVNVMAVGIVKPHEICTNEAQGVGNSLILLGSKTGRDGLHGASFASRELDIEADERPSVQVGDPFTEKKLIEATLEVSQLKSLVAMQDMGAAGILSSTAEMAAIGGLGLDLFLDQVPLREEGMEPWEILLSESQERMAFVIEKGHEGEVKEIADKWELDFARIGVLTSGEEFRVFWKGELVASLPFSLIVNPPDLSREIERNYPTSSRVALWSGQVRELLLDLLSHPTIACKRSVYERYDYAVRGKTVKPPGSDAAVLYLEGKKGIALTLGGNSRYTALHPREGTKAVLFEACCNIISSGGKPLGITNCFNFGNPEKEPVSAQFFAALMGLEEGAKILGISVTGGNVSFYNESQGKQVPPTPVIGVVGEVEDIERIPVSRFVRTGDLIYLIGRRLVPQNGASLYLLEEGLIKEAFPQVDWEECARTLEAVRSLVASNLIVALHDVSEGGIIVSCAEMALGGGKGANISTEVHPFEEYPARFIAEVSSEHVREFQEFLEKREIEFSRIGQIGGENFIWNGEEIPLPELEKAYHSLEGVE
ncbi:MAG: phosphoribosylformylglycinamidine synthase subunit PurL [Caldiserica bacterium]|jgi:phosphoribosylformylglycinamidine synthase|nr:phosphoribosylformylglycinamidine synthase subunit PurL [Caldisericota bacterium]